MNSSTRMQLQLIVETCGQNTELTNRQIRSMFSMLASNILSEPQQLKKTKDINEVLVQKQASSKEDKKQEKQRQKMQEFQQQFNQLRDITYNKLSLLNDKIEKITQIHNTEIQGLKNKLGEYNEKSKIIGDELKNYGIKMQKINKLLTSFEEQIKQIKSSIDLQKNSRTKFQQNNNTKMVSIEQKLASLKRNLQADNQVLNQFVSSFTKIQEQVTPIKGQITKLQNEINKIKLKESEDKRNIPQVPKKLIVTKDNEVKPQEKAKTEQINKIQQRKNIQTIQIQQQEQKPKKDKQYVNLIQELKNYNWEMKKFQKQKSFEKEDSSQGEEEGSDDEDADDDDSDSSNQPQNDLIGRKIKPPQPKKKKRSSFKSIKVEEWISKSSFYYSQLKITKSLISAKKRAYIFGNPISDSFQFSVKLTKKDQQIGFGIADYAQRLRSALGNFSHIQYRNDATLWRNGQLDLHVSRLRQLKKGHQLSIKFNIREFCVSWLIQKKVVYEQFISHENKTIRWVPFIHFYDHGGSVRVGK